jgi:hypothetical protein
MDKMRMESEDIQQDNVAEDSRAVPKLRYRGTGRGRTSEESN